MASLTSPLTFPSRPPCHQGHHSRPRSIKMAWRDLPARALDVNLLTHSLTSRLRHPTLTSLWGRCRSEDALCQRRTQTDPRSPSMSPSRSPSQQCRASAGQGVEDRGRKEKVGGVSSSGRPTARSRTSSPPDGKGQGGTSQRVTLDHRVKFNSDRGTSFFTGHGGGGYLAASTSLDRVGHGYVTWVKRSGIFQPADKYARGRQRLWGETSASAAARHSLGVEYHTVRLSSGPNTPRNVPTPRPKTRRPRTELKVSWKSSSSTEPGPQQANRHSLPRAARRLPGDTQVSKAVSSVPVRMRSAGPVCRGRGRGRSPHGGCVGGSGGGQHVPYIGLKWKLPSAPVSGQTDPNRSPSPSSPSLSSSRSSSPSSIKSAATTTTTNNNINTLLLNKAGVSTASRHDPAPLQQTSAETAQRTGNDLVTGERSEMAHRGQQSGGQQTDGKVTASGEALQETLPASKRHAPSSAKVPYKPSSGKLSDVPSNGKLPNVPSSGKLSDVPSNGKLPKVPSSGKLSDVPSSGKLSDVPSSSSLEASGGVPVMEELMDSRWQQWHPALR